MCHVFGRVSIVLLVVAVLVAAGSVVVADPLENQVLKFQQQPMHGVEIGREVYWGHDEWSTIYGDREWDSYSYRPPRLDLPFDGGVYMADDFADPFDTPVVHVQWWGSYMENFMGPQEQGVQRFLISFETDVPIGPDNPFSHPGEPILNQVVEWVPYGDPLRRGSGTFHERPKPGDGEEMLFEYNAELKLPFWQDPDTVYWLKVVALVDAPDASVDNLVWGWHNRDYTQKNEYASHEVMPGEFIQGFIPDPVGGPDAEIWHFQDAAVMGELDTVIALPTPPGNELEWHVWQNSANPDNRWPMHYLSGFDGPYEAEMERYSKDLAFELFTVACLIPGDANLDGIVDDQDASILAAHWQMFAGATWSDGDFNDDGKVNDEDASILAAHWQETCPHPTPEPHTIVLLAGALLALPLLRRRKRT